MVGAASVRVEADAPLVLAGPDGARLAIIGAGEIWRVTVCAAGLLASGPSGGGQVTSTRFGLGAADGGTPVRVNGRPFRGTFDLIRDRTGLTVVNRVGLEDYVSGVVSAEMGRRAPEDEEALKAQAVVSRTYARRGAGRRRVEGFDLYATVADQVYGGVTAETVEGNAAVRSTRGLIVAWGGAPIDAFFYSTCGGRTAEGTEVFRGASRPYLRSMPDLADNGAAYCSLSPRFRWREEWSRTALRRTLGRTIPTLPGRAGTIVSEVRDVRVGGRAGSGRVAEVIVALDRETIAVDGPGVRRVLATASGDPLRSNLFTLTVSRAGGEVSRMVADGSGAGHGVGFCQWGAVGRSRAGQRYPDILSAYYPGTQLERLY